MVNGKKLISLCTSRVYDSQVFGFIKTMGEMLQKENCALMIFTINSDIYWEEDINPAETYVFDIIPYAETDCILIMDEKIKSHSVSNRIISKAKKAGVPVVVVDGEYEGTTRVNFDYEAGFEQITRHIIEDHHAKHPHMMAGLRDNVFSDRRIDIFKKVLAENNIAFNDTMLSYGDFWADPTRTAMEEIIKRDTLPDAIICANDIMAINVNDMLQLAGIDVPGQVMVSGFDGIEEVFFTTPKIASCSCDTILLAEAAAECAIKIANGETVSDKYITPQLIPNESCGCPEHLWNVHNLMTNFNNNFYRHQDDTRILYNIASNMEISKTAWEMASNIHNHKTKHSLTVVDRNVFRTDSNIFMNEAAERNTPDLHLINDADYAEEHRFEKLPLTEELFYDPTVNTEENVLSGNFRARIIELLDRGYPLIFHALDYMNRPFGFNCYYYPEYVVTDYSRAAIVTNSISMGIGGFVNLQYQKCLLQKMDNMYKHDALTGLYNRIGFLKVYDELRGISDNQGKDVTIIMSDLDGLKYINDNFGHAHGDKSITAVANALKKACPSDALCARFGGDELFSVILGKCDAEDIIRKIDLDLEEYNRKANLPYTVSTSCGAYHSSFDAGFDFLKSLKIADERMYEAKSKKDYPHA
ncbi:MAG: GGDEF domain-containing protein [Lachnospiraceae bacterium]|nr:GGDEF domain-containing protein [Lachnospiraceae bacterium]